MAAAKRLLAQRCDHELARPLLLPRRDRVLEVEEDLVGGQPGRLGEEALARAGHGVAGAAGADGAGARWSRGRA